MAEKIPADGVPRPAGDDQGAHDHERTEGQQERKTSAGSCRLPLATKSTDMTVQPTTNIVSMLHATQVERLRTVTPRPSAASAHAPRDGNVLGRDRPEIVTKSAPGTISATMLPRRLRRLANEATVHCWTTVSRCPYRGARSAAASGAATTSELIQHHIQGVSVVKAFNTSFWQHLRDRVARPATRTGWQSCWPATTMRPSGPWPA
jgi:hypothetical protein